LRFPVDDVVEDEPKSCRDPFSLYLLVAPTTLPFRELEAELE
jgi:hypothetical protein